MTRDEAIRAFDGISNPGSFGTPAWIDRFVALGMLKLDEPKNAEMQAGEIIDSYIKDGGKVAAILMEFADAGISLSFASHDGQGEGA